MEQETVDDLLAAWDAGGTIWTVEMGGLGPGYEQALQIAAVEFARAGKAMTRTDNDEADYKAFGALCDAALKSFDEQVGGLSGAQYGAAKWLAWRWCFGGGPKRLIEVFRAESAKRGEKSDRVIQCSRTYPVAPSVKVSA
jgi:hypothetical protein